MPARKRKQSWEGRVYLGRDENDAQHFYWVGRFDTKRERDAAVAKAKTEKPWDTRPPDELTCGEWVDRFLARYERLTAQRERKATSLDSARTSLRAFRRDFAETPLNAVTPVDVEDWVPTVPRHAVKWGAMVFTYAKRMKVLTDNPFDGLIPPRGRGRADKAPPTLEELQLLREACDALGDYADQMRDLMDFAAYTLMRPSELYELRHPDVDLAHNRILVARRVCRGVVDVPKNGKPKTIALVPPAREILLRQPTRTRDDGLVFIGLKGTRLSATIICKYWARVKARAGLDFEFYTATKHYGVHRLYGLGLSRRAIGAQAGWAEGTVDEMLGVYGHTELVTLAEVDALYADGSDANVAQEGRNRP